ncbi:aspartate aminotransferase family protein [Candidatus Soleaferrea massiliensis]|uniref:aspartate aminotransferase family protein n=1 Tax=Candidatus Soleaferrea massiliensis TaxID=1470354 RepID=UPI00058DA948|nr:aspartate aminotransferase family protein [Candidatus Soleaferrea massiliensis]
MKHEELKKLDQTYVMNTYARSDVSIDCGRNAICWDLDGKAYIDFGSGIGVNSLGFCDKEWTAAVTAQLGKLAHTSNLYMTEPQAKLAEQLCGRTGMKRVFYANSGAEANEGAIKLARKYSEQKYGRQRTGIVTLKQSFHGRTVTTLAATGQDFFHQYFYPFTEGFRYAPANDFAGLKAAVDETTCAVMMELIQGEGGVIPLEKEFVDQAAAFCQENDLLLIIDEVQTGIGRTGKLLCCEHYGLKPDIVTLAKGLGGGLPIGAVLTGEKSDVFTFTDHATTFGGNPVVCSGALAVLERIDEAFLKEVLRKGEKIRSLVMRMKHVEGVDGKGMMMGIRLDDSVKAGEIAKKCLENGLIVLTAKTKLRFLPPLTITDEEIENGLTILQQVLEQC